MSDLAPQDHDLLIRLDEKVTMIARKQDDQHASNIQTITSLLERLTTFEKRVETIELWQATQHGAQLVMVRTATIISSLISSVIAGLIVYFVTHH